MYIITLQGKLVFDQYQLDGNNKQCPTFIDFDLDEINVRIFRNSVDAELEKEYIKIGFGYSDLQVIPLEQWIIENKK